MFKRTAIAGLIPALVVTAVLMVAFMSPVGATRATVFSTSCDAYPYSRVTVDWSASPAQPVHEGTAVDITATSTGCTNPEYKFYAAAPGGSYVAVRGYGASTFHWVTTGARDGNWSFSVWVRQIGSGIAYAAYSVKTYKIIAACTSATLTATPGSPSAKGTAVNLSASSTGCSAPQYMFWVKIGLRYVAFGPYSSATARTWSTRLSAYHKGRNSLSLWVRQTGSLNKWDSYQQISYYLT